MSTDLLESTGTATEPLPSFGLAAAVVAGEETVVVVVADAHYSLEADGPGTDRLPDLIAAWPERGPDVIAAAAAAIERGTRVEVERWLVPVEPSKLVCVGTNYHDHLREMGTPGSPATPYSFLKPTSTGLVPSGASVVLPRRSTMVDWEAELAVVIGAPAHDDADPSIMDCVAGYTVLNDLSARDWIKNRPEVGMDWVMQKGFDGFSPVGPIFTPRQFVPNVGALAVRCWVNGEIKQDSNTSQMVFDVEAILRHLTGIMTLLPGDVIATGTPAGVGFGARPQQFLQDGDVVVVEVEGLGRLETHMVDPFKGERV